MTVMPEQAALEENLKKLETSEITPYLSGLSRKLRHLSEILSEDGDSFVAPYLSVIRDTIECLILKHEIGGDDKIDFSLTIDPTESGFPTVKDFYLLQKNKESAESALAGLPQREEIIGSVRSAILGSRSPAHSQILLRRHNFYSKLNEINSVLEEYSIAEPVFAGEEDGRRRYTIEWSCIERGANIPVFYRMCFTQDGKHPRLEKVSNDALKTLIYATQFGRLDVKQIVEGIDNQVEEIHPKLLEKYRIGPYYNTHTENSEPMSKVLQSADEPSILRFATERVMSEGTRQFGSRWDRLFGKKTEREVFSPIDAEAKLIVPFRIKQVLGDRDEFDRPCKVYAVTKSGGITY